jgi:hypothetical protein
LVKEETTAPELRLDPFPDFKERFFGFPYSQRRREDKILELLISNPEKGIKVGFSKWSIDT